MIIKKGGSGRLLSRAMTLKMKDKKYTNLEVADILEITPRTVINIIENYLSHGLDKALNDDPRPGQPIQFDDRIKSNIVAMVCADPPEGFDRWTLTLIKEQSEKRLDTKISKESVRLILQEHDLKPWLQKMWCITELNEEYIENMEDVLKVYEKDYNPDYPVINFDEKPVALFSDKRDPMLMEPGKVLKRDYEYERNGSVNVFCAVEPLKGIYFNRVTENRKGDEFAKMLGSLARRYKKAKKIILVMDNLNTHREKSLLNFYGDKEGAKLWKRFEVHYTPKHGSWLNQAEIAIGMYARQCLGHSRIGDIETLRKKTNAWNKIINRKNVIIKWKFTRKDARDKFKYK